MNPANAPYPTFLFTDIEASTRLWEEHPQAMAAVLEEHNELIRSAIEAHSGSVFKTVGDGFCATFQDATAALDACIDAQLALKRIASPADSSPLRVRMAVHTGPARFLDGDHFGPSVNRVARLLAIGHGGQILVSESTRRFAGANIPSRAGLLDLGHHELRDLRDPERVYQVTHPDLPASFPRLRASVGRLDNLPPSRTSFVGRGREIDDLIAQLDTASLITLTGVGGTGKTRLAIEVATRVREGFLDGIWLVELAPLSDSGLVTRAVADAVGTREESGRDLHETLAIKLSDRRLLLILDNCEHVIESAAALADALLDRCPGVRILATSREPLGIEGERIWPVSPLGIPVAPTAGSGSYDVVALREYESVQLFEARARIAQPTFRLSVANADPVARICARLEGLPLAIELAAARVNTLPPAELAKRLENRFLYLTGGSRMALPRQRTLRAAIDWSYDLLADDERTLLARLSVFRGSFDLESAEDVCGGAPSDPTRFVNSLTSLVLKSLVELNENDRYRLLETVREYAAEKLLGSDEAQTYWERHRDRYIALAEASAPALTGPDQGEWLPRLELEHDNFRIALEWSLAEGDTCSALRLAGALGRFWRVHGHFSDGRAWLGRALETEADSPAGLQAQAALWAGHLARNQGDLDAATRYLDSSLTLSRESGDQKRIAAALNALAILADVRGEPTTARRLWEDSLSIARALDDRRGIAAALGNLGLLERTAGDPDRSRQMLEESLDVFRECGDKAGISSMLNNLGVDAFDRGDLDHAWALYEESLVLDQELGHRRGIGQSLANLGLIAAERGDLATAREFMEGAQRISYELGDRQSIGNHLMTLAYVLLGEDRAEDGARVQGAAAAFLESIGAAFDRGHGTGYAKTTDALRHALGAKRYEEEWQAGRKLPLDDAVSLALTAPGEPSGSDP